MRVQHKDWYAWHSPYDDPGSQLARRLAVVQGQLSDALDRCRSGRIRVTSMCAGQGRDILGVLARHPRAGDVVARLVEFDPRNAAVARQGAAPFPGVEVVEGDAGRTDAYAGAVPVDVLLACGVFGNISDEDIERTVAAFPSLCAPGATVIWTRHRQEPDVTPRVREWFRSAGFEEVAFCALPDSMMTVGSNRLVGEALPFRAGQYLFRFDRTAAPSAGGPLP